MRPIPTVVVAVAVTATVAAWPAAPLAHELLHEVRRGADAVAVRAFESDGGALADVPYEVYSPAGPGSPHQRGRTDRNGWLAFVPDVPGKWRVRVVEEGGHGLDLLIDAAAASAASPGAGPGAAFALRPVLALLALAGIFAALWAVQRRRRRA